MRWPTGKQQTLVVLGAVGVVLVAVFAFSRDGGTASERSDAGLDPEDVLDERQIELVSQAVPDAGCAREPAAPPDDESRVALEVMWLEGTCLLTRTEYLAEGEVAARCRELAEDPAVVVAGVSPTVDSTSTGEGDDDEDDLREEQWALDALGEDSSEPAWPGGRGAVVALVDTGVYASHGDLGDAVIGRRHFPDEGELDADGHGTHLAGIIAARRGNGGIVGVAPEASILDVPRRDGTRPQAGSWETGLVWAVNSGATVANLSFGSPLARYESPGSLELAAVAVAFAQRHDVVVVAAAGNCGPDPEDFVVQENGLLRGCDETNQRQVPAAFGDAVVAVGAVERDGDGLRLAGYSTRNGDVDLVAPGHENVSTYPPDKECEESETTDTGAYCTTGATSQAAPHVAAAVAVAQSAYPTATADQIVEALRASADRERLGDQERSDPGSGAGFLEIDGLLDELRSSVTTGTPDRSDGADRTQVAFVREGMLYAFDGARAHPVRRVDPAAPVTWLEWSGDHTRLVGLAGATLFSWAGPGTQPAETDYQPSCGSCGPGLAYLDAISRPEGQGTRDVVVSLHYDGTLTQYDAATLEEMGSTALSFPPAAAGTKTLRGDVGGRLVVHETGGAHAAERLWLVDPASGEAEVSQEVVGGLPAGRRVVVDAADARIAFVDGYDSCSSANRVHVLDAAGLSQVAEAATPSGPDDPTGAMVDELFFNGDALYATIRYRSSGGTGPCEAGSAGLWRLDGDTWEQVSPEPLANARPLEGRSGGEPTGWLTIGTDGRGSLRPIQTDDISLGDLGVLDPVLWATPTLTEIDFG